MSPLFDASYIALWKCDAVFGEGTRLRRQKNETELLVPNEQAKCLAERGDFLEKHFTTLEFPY